MKIVKYQNSKGLALISVLMLITLMGLMLTAYHTLTKYGIQGLKSSNNYEHAFFAAEAGLNARAEEFRQTFSFSGLPTGSSPTEPNPCTSGNMGSGDLACENYTFGNQTATTYALKGFDNDPITVTIPVGEAFEGLLAYEYKYDLISTAKNPTEEIGSILALRFNSRVVPMFQFAAFYDKDLEISTVGDMLISGPIHTNGNLYAHAASSVDLVINGQVTVAGDIYRGKKGENQCYSGEVSVIHGDQVEITDPSDFSSFLTSEDFTGYSTSSDYNCVSGNRTDLSGESFSEWNDNIIQGIDGILVPDVASTYPGAGNQYWDMADVRLVLNLDGSDNIDKTDSVTGIEVRNLDGSLNEINTDNLDLSCAAGTLKAHDDDFWDQLRQDDIITLEVDLENLLDCLHSTGIVSLSDSSQGGHTIYLTVEGEDSTCSGDPCHNNYGVRIKNAANLIDLSPAMNGLTIVTDQPMYTMGNFNVPNGSGDKVPSSLYGDNLTILSSNWNSSYDSNTQVSQSKPSSHWSNYMDARNADHTEINAALVFGTITTGGAEGTAGHGLDPNSAGLNNYAKLLEDWERGGGSNQKTLTINGAFISLSKALRSRTLSSGGSNAGIHTGYHYEVPTRLFSFDESFNDVNNHPPGSLSFVYLKQVFFARDFEQ